MSLRNKDEERPRKKMTDEKSSLKKDSMSFTTPKSYQHQRGAAEGASESQTKKIKFRLSKIFAAKVFFGIVLLAFILVCTVFSKLTLVSLTDRLRSVTAVHFNESRTYLYDEDQGETTLIPFLAEHDIAVSLYWQLLLIFIVPNIISFLRSLAFGVLGKTQKNFPRPEAYAIFLVSSILLVCCKHYT